VGERDEHCQLALAETASVTGIILRKMSAFAGEPTL
jgi:hypothetical protein